MSVCVFLCSVIKNFLQFHVFYFLFCIHVVVFFIRRSVRFTEILSSIWRKPNLFLIEDNVSFDCNKFCVFFLHLIVLHFIYFFCIFYCQKFYLWIYSILLIRYINQYICRSYSERTSKSWSTVSWKGD